MEESYSLAEGRGKLTLRQDGVRVVCQAELTDDGRGLYKAYLTGPGERYLLGTLMPEGGLLRLKRTITVDELRRNRLWPPQGGQVELAFSAEQGMALRGHIPAGWSREHQPERLLGDSLLRRAAMGMGEVLLRSVHGGFQLAVPFCKTSPFPLTPLFCFAQLEPLEEKIYIVFSFNSQGLPQFSQIPPDA